MSPQAKQSVVKYAPAVAAIITCISMVVGAIGTYTKTAATVDDLKADRKAQIESNQRVAERLAAIEATLKIRQVAKGD